MFPQGYLQCDSALFHRLKYQWLFPSAPRWRMEYVHHHLAHGPQGEHRFCALPHVDAGAVGAPAEQMM